MNHEFFTNWKNGVKELNKTADEVSFARDEAYELLANEIKKIFARNGTVVDTLHFNSDASVITVELTGDHSKSITFKKSFLFEIGMGFSVIRKMTDRGDMILYVELYPLDEEV